MTIIICLVQLYVLILKKAFDSLNWNFMLKALSHYGFIQSFIKWIQVIYNEPTFCVKNNGLILKEDVMMRVIGQGCAVSALRFILSVEFMAVEMRQNNNFKGIADGTFESKILQYADDTTLTLQCNKSVSLAISEIYRFFKVSGLNLNPSKSLGILLGLLYLNPLIFEGISFTNEPIRCLGIYVAKNKTVCLEKNWEDILKKLEKILNI